MRVLALMTDAFGGRGGIAEYNRNWLAAWATLGHEARVLTRLPPPDAAAPPPGVVQRAPRYGRPGLVLRAAWEMVTWRPDLLFCGHLYLLPACAVLGALWRIPVWVQVHGIDAWSPLGRPYRWGLRRTARVLAVSDYTRRRLLEWAPIPAERVAVLPNTYDEGLFCPGPRAEALVRRFALGGRRVLLSVGRLDARERYKGQDRIIRLLPRLLHEAPGLLYLIAGDGDDRPRLERLAREQGVAEAVRFAGFVAHAELPDLYRLADLFVLAGHGEGFGIVLLEALACGVPVIASRRDGSREAVADGALGAVVDPEDQQALTAAILTALTGPRPDPAAVRARFGLAAFRAGLARILESNAP